MPVRYDRSFNQFRIVEQSTSQTCFKILVLITRVLNFTVSVLPDVQRSSHGHSYLPVTENDFEFPSLFEQLLSQQIILSGHRTLVKASLLSVPLVCVQFYTLHVVRFPTICETRVFQEDPFLINAFEVRLDSSVRILILFGLKFALYYTPDSVNSPRDPSF